MSTPKQIAANRRNAKKSTGPKSEEGKSRARQNAFRHGLTAETVVTVFEDAEEYARFEETVMADFDPQTAVEAQLVLRVASLLWRLRRALAIESGLFQIQGRALRARPQQKHKTRNDPLQPFRSLLDQHHTKKAAAEALDTDVMSVHSVEPSSVDPTLCFLRIINLDNEGLERIGRYETRLWRQLAQTLYVLDAVQRQRRGPPMAPRKQTLWQVARPIRSVDHC